jgi:ribosomal protein S18 acetylase RimI-like enzyme
MIIRPPGNNDWRDIGALGEQLVRAHHAFDSHRFIGPDRLRGDVYVARVREEIDRGSAAVLVADEAERVVGFVFVGVERASWKELRDEAGYVHDLVVDPASRDKGVGRALVSSAIEWLRARGVERIMLWTAHDNVAAQGLFRTLGFRPTMIEMTLGVRDSQR